VKQPQSAVAAVHDVGSGSHENVLGKDGTSVFTTRQ
jgi:hypothetical protein